jgi:hypothetical protein
MVATADQERHLLTSPTPTWPVIFRVAREFGERRRPSLPDAPPQTASTADQPHVRTDDGQPPNVCRDARDTLLHVGTRKSVRRTHGVSSGSRLLCVRESAVSALVKNSCTLRVPPRVANGPKVLVPPPLITGTQMRMQGGACALRSSHAR